LAILKPIQLHSVLDFIIGVKILYVILQRGKPRLSIIFL